jgi:protein disulfide-isomerase
VKSSITSLFSDFTGSDWSGWCIKLHNEVFSKPEFSEYAKKNLVLVEVDFPRKKQQSEELKKANQALQEKYKIEGYPTIIVLDGNGKKVGELGYQPGGPKAFIAELDKLKSKG